MFCPNCSRLIDDNAKTCVYCGKTISPAQQTGSDYQRSFRSMGTNSPTLLMAAIFILIAAAFCGILADWIVVKGSFLGETEKQHLSFSDVFDSDYDNFTSYDSAIGEADEYYGGRISEILSESDYNAAKWGFRMMKWGGIAGYILLVCSVTALVVKRELLCILTALSSAAFVISLVGLLIYCSKAEKVFREVMKYMPGIFSSMKIEANPALGILLSAGGAVSACVCSIILKKNYE